jgi:hypothetical protein
MGMHTLEYTDAELTILRSALHAFLDDFRSKDDQDLVRQITELLAKLPPP